MSIYHNFIKLYKDTIEWDFEINLYIGNTSVLYGVYKRTKLQSKLIKERGI